MVRHGGGSLDLDPILRVKRDVNCDLTKGIGLQMVTSTQLLLKMLMLLLLLVTSVQSISNQPGGGLTFPQLDIRIREIRQIQFPSFQFGNWAVTRASTPTTSSTPTTTQDPARPPQPAVILTKCANGFIACGQSCCQAVFNANNCPPLTFNIGGNCVPFG